MMRVLVALLALLASSAAQAQTYRPTPGNDAAPFVAVSEPGATCPSCQVLLLQDAWPPPPHVNVYGPTVAVSPKATADVLIYDGATGSSLLVVSTPFGAMAPYAAIGLYERVSWVALRPGMLWATGDLDGDGRTDLIGHDKRTGEIVRLYRRGY